MLCVAVTDDGESGREAEERERNKFFGFEISWEQHHHRRRLQPDADEITIGLLRRRRQR